MDDERDLVRWALAADIPRAQHIGIDRVRLVLVALTTYTDPNGHAWPSAELLASGIGGLSRRRVREAFEVLEESGLITRDGRRGRALRWQVAGSAAISPESHLAGIPATTRHDLAGEVAGDLAGNLAGIPATSGVEKEMTHSHAPDDGSAAQRPDPVRYWLGSQMRAVRDEDLAVFAESHPGREREAVIAGRRWYFAHKGEELHSAAAYFGKWKPAELADKIKLSAPQRPPCDQCEGGWLTDDRTHMPTAPCPNCKPPA